MSVLFHLGIVERNGAPGSILSSLAAAPFPGGLFTHKGEITKIIVADSCFSSLDKITAVRNYNVSSFVISGGGKQKKGISRQQYLFRVRIAVEIKIHPDPGNGEQFLTVP